MVIAILEQTEGKKKIINNKILHCKNKQGAVVLTVAWAFNTKEQIFKWVG